ncbi:facilitated trehalose transporter Tret1-like, partial [Sitodiplosis mosellana]|uniref:facilitated trehalose transporter Tret1-like n=1 Tax=Sitodiplosis mosellana TaxID=263140 RepID=UPI002444E2F9
ITNKFGRKKPLFITAFPTIISWILVLIAPNVYYLYASRLLAGFFGGGVYVIVPLYLSELSNNRIRGALISSLVLSESFGIVLAFIFGHYFDFYTLPILVISLMSLFAFLLYFFPETPTFLVKQHRILQAEKSIRFYQNLSEGYKEDKLVKMEINKLTNNEEESKKKTIKWSDLTAIPVRRAFTIGIVLIVLNELSGFLAMLNYTANIFEDAGSDLHPNVSAIVIGAIQLFGTAIAMNLVDRTGRKILFAVSNIGTALGFIVLGVYMMFKLRDYPVEDFNWIPVMSFSFISLIASLGIVSLPLLVFSEVVPEKLKDFGVAAYLTLSYLAASVLIKYLPIIIDSVGFDMSMFLFAGLCVACEVYIIFSVPETKGKSHEDIIEAMTAH